MNGRQEFKGLPTLELIEQSYGEQDEEEYWRLITILHEWGTVTEFRAAEELCRNPIPIRREIGADILGQLGWQNRAFQAESVAILVGLLSDSEVDVIASAAFSLGHRNDPEAIPGLIKLVHHPNERVRFGVTFGLCGHEDLRAIEGLIVLSKDESEDVRNWTSFGLGTQIETESEEINAALIARLIESNQEIRGEALVGLAKRRHPIAIERLIKELVSREINVLILEAAEILSDPRLYPLLQKWKNIKGQEDPYFESQLDRALDACNRDKRT